MSPSQIKQQIAILLETEPSNITVKLTNKPEDNQYDPIIALHILLPIVEKHDHSLAEKLNEIVFKDLCNSENDIQNNYTIVISEESQSKEVKTINDLPSVFRFSRRVNSDE